MSPTPGKQVAEEMTMDSRPEERAAPGAAGRGRGGTRVSSLQRGDPGAGVKVIGPVRPRGGGGGGLAAA